MSADNDRIAGFEIARCNLNAWDANLRDILAISAEFETLGVPTVSSSRINAYRAAFQSLWDVAHKQRTLDLSLATRVLNTMVEYNQLKTIVKAATASSNRDMWKERLRQLVPGAEFSTGESHSTSARDLQFESFIGAVCELSGYAVRFDEPDIVIADKSQVFGIAAKRPRNEHTILKKFRKGVRQLRISGMAGLIALDVSFALQADQCINTNDLHGGRIFVERVADRFMCDNQTDLQRLCRGERVLGVLIHVQMPLINFGHPDGPQLGTAIRWTIAPFADPGAEGIFWANELCRRCERGLFGPRTLQAR